MVDYKAEITWFLQWGVASKLINPAHFNDIKKLNKY
jgi:hypothetical protein